MKSSSLTVCEAIESMQKLICMCTDEGFNLTRFTSNIKEELQVKGVKEKDLMASDIPEEKALGPHWNNDEDVLMFKIKSIKKPLTRQELLSTPSSIDDALDLESPFILEGKGIIQSLCKEKMRWDEEMSVHHKSL